VELHLDFDRPTNALQEASSLLAKLVGREQAFEHLHRYIEENTADRSE
jgi:hypothetical protein